MSKRLQVILKDPEYKEIQNAARLRNISVAEWVRLALRIARNSESSGNLGKKLDAIRTAARHEFPTADIDRMLAEVERGYDAGTNP